MCEGVTDLLLTHPLFRAPKFCARRQRMAVAASHSAATGHWAKTDQLVEKAIPGACAPLRCACRAARELLCDLPRDHRPRSPPVQDNTLSRTSTDLERLEERREETGVMWGAKPPLSARSGRARCARVFSVSAVHVCVRANVSLFCACACACFCVCVCVCAAPGVYVWTFLSLFFRGLQSPQTVKTTT